MSVDLKATGPLQFTNFNETYKDPHKYVLLFLTYLFRKVKETAKSEGKEEEDDVSESGEESDDDNHDNEDFPDYKENGYHPTHIG